MIPEKNDIGGNSAPLQIITPGNSPLNLEDLPKDLQQKIINFSRLDELKDRVKDDIRAAGVNWQEYRESWVESKRSMHTRRVYKTHLLQFTNYLKEVKKPGKMSPVFVGPMDIDNYIQTMKKRGYAANSIRAHIMTIGSFYNYLKRGRVYSHDNPTRGATLPRKEFKKRKKGNGKISPVMTHDEFKIILNAIGNTKKSRKKYFCIISLMVNYGLRRGAISEIQIDISSGLMTSITKGEKRIEIMLTHSDRELLEKCDCWKVIPFDTATGETLYRFITRLTKKLKMNGAIKSAYTPHDFRHLAALQVWTKTGDIFRVKDFLGHSSIQTTAIYLQQTHNIQIKGAENNGTL